MNKTVAIIAGIIVIGGGAFFGGMKYGQAKNSGASGGMRMAGFAGQMRGGVVRMNGASGAGLISGEILSKDATSVTVKLREGGSKIVLFATSTTISKTAAGSKNDLVVGTQITATGKANSDGSISAETIAVRPAGSPGLQINGMFNRNNQ